MKHLLYLLLSISPSLGFSQYDNFLREYFLGRLPAARAEAMGGAYSSVEGGMSSVFFNPAGVVKSKGLEIYGSKATPYYLLKEAKYTFIGIGYKLNRHIALGISMNTFSLGEPISVYDDNYNFIKNYDGYINSNYCITLSAEPIKNLMMGLNTNVFVWDPVLTKKATNLNYDFGIIKIISIKKSGGAEQSVNFGAAISNFSNSKVKLKFNGKNTESDLPVTAKLAASYNHVLKNHSIIDTLKNISFLVQLEYQNLLNSKTESAIRTGGEIVFLEMIALRAGYSEQKVYDYDHPETNNGQLTAFTYGFGLQIPLHKLSKIPLLVKFDFTSLPQQSYAKSYSNWDNFNTFSCQLNWIFKKAK